VGAKKNGGALEPPLVVVAAEGRTAEAALLLDHLEPRRGGAAIVVESRVDVEVVVIEHVKRFGAELQAEPLGQFEALADREVVVPSTGRAEGVATGHIGWIRPEVGDTERRVQRTDIRRRRNRERGIGVG